MNSYSTDLMERVVAAPATDRDGTRKHIAAASRSASPGSATFEATAQNGSNSPAARSGGRGPPSTS